ncbi:MAG TPA: type II toxin-antitoxin system ParD family antitoxin [Devosiaceae bacterium]|nr:type II toxin-antitoxin system ParD family antitoxin [Devosiaceae bacterium]
MPSSYTIGEHFEALVQRLVASGRYASASEVVRDGLRLLEEQEQVRALKLEALRAEIQKGLEGPFEPWDAEEFLREARRRLDAGEADAA